MLDPYSRGAIVVMCALCVAGAIAFAPLRARSSSDPGVPQRTASVGMPLIAAAERDIDVRRDPFAAEPTPHPTASVMPTSPNVQLGTLPHADATLPSNLAQSIVPAMPGDAVPSPSAPSSGAGTAGAPRVTAIVTGAHPFAMLDSGGNHQIKGIGDRVNGTPIVAIDITGVTLQGGVRLTVTPGELSQ